MFFYVLLVLLTAIYIAVLELSKNVLAGWAVALMCMLGAMIIKRKTGKVVITFIVFLVLLAVNYFLTKPPVKRASAVDNRNPDVTDVVRTLKGDVTGVYNKDHSVKVFAGIPYAAPPVGELRFKEPQEVQPWDGVLACDHFGPMAMQPTSSVIYDSLSRILGFHDYKVQFGDEFVEEMSEDCLYLNVFTPEKKSEELLPVIVYIHGGSLTTGTSSYYAYRGEDLAKKGVVFVNLAYRLGVFGYYAADDLKAESPNNTTGNYGLLDQVAALKWVYDNIEAFGGDKNRITIAGESAGASSVNALCISPLTEGLFRYAIAESSAVVAKKPFHTFRDYEEAVATGDKVREEFGVSSSMELRDIPADELLKTKTDNTAMTIDGYAIEKQPYLYYEQGENHEKALLNGFNLMEADAFKLDVKATKDNYEDLLSEDIGEYAAEMAQVVPYNLPQRDEHIIIDKLGEAKGALNVVYSAMWFSYSHYVWNNYMVAQNRPAYEYYFTKANKGLSSHHAGELPYAYGNLWRRKWVYDNEDFKLSDIMQSYWVNFAYNGDPNGFYRTDDGKESTEKLPVWDMRTTGQDKLLVLDKEVKMEDDPNNAIYKVIDKYMDSLGK